MSTRVVLRPRIRHRLGVHVAGERLARPPRRCRTRAIAIDLLGHGTADKPHDPDAYADLEGYVLDRFPDEPVDAIGFSLGAPSC